MLFDRDNRVMKRDTFIMIAHQCRYAELPSRLDDLIRPWRKVDKISKTKNRILLPLVQIF